MVDDRVQDVPALERRPFELPRAPVVGLELEEALPRTDEQRDAHAGSLTTPSRARSAISSSVKPASASTSAVCAPSAGRRRPVVHPLAVGGERARRPSPAPGRRGGEGTGACRAPSSADARRPVRRPAPAPRARRPPRADRAGAAVVSTRRRAADELVELLAVSDAIGIRREPLDPSAAPGCRARPRAPRTGRRCRPRSSPRRRPWRRRGTARSRGSRCRAGPGPRRYPR